VCDGEALQYASSGGVRGKGIVISDIPGLLEGAHRGLGPYPLSLPPSLLPLVKVLTPPRLLPFLPSLPPGLGLAFLRHIERCRIILHVVNGASVDPIGDFVAINQVGEKKRGEREGARHSEHHQ